MFYKVSILSEAERDIDDAFIWYEMKQIGLGDQYFETLHDSVFFISKNPLGIKEVYKNVRRFVINKFPYGLYYNVNLTKKQIQIIGVIHFKRSSKIIKRRI